MELKVENVYSIRKNVYEGCEEIGTFIPVTVNPYDNVVVSV